MPLDDAVDDEQPEADAARLHIHLSCTAAERGEQMRKELLSDRLPIVVHLEADLLGAALDPYGDVSIGRRILEGIPDQVDDDLRDAIRVPLPMSVALALQL